MKLLPLALALLAAPDLEETHAWLRQKTYSPAHRSSPLVTEPDTWNAVVEINGKLLGCSISRQQYEDLLTNQFVKVLIGHGRISGKPYCKDILI